MIPAEQGLAAQAAGRGTLTGVLGAAWGIGGIAALLLYAVVQLTGYVSAAVADGLAPAEWLLLAANVTLMVWAEGVRGFQQRFAPRVAARALALRERPEPVTVLLAPLYCVGYFRATPGLRRLAWVGTGLIVAAVLAVQQVGQPWRGILDAGVVAGLTWGTLAVLVQGARALYAGRATVPPGLS